MVAEVLKPAVVQRKKMLREDEEPQNEYRRHSQLGAVRPAHQKTSTSGQEAGRGYGARRS